MNVRAVVFVFVCHALWCTFAQRLCAIRFPNNLECMPQPWACPQYNPIEVPNSTTVGIDVPASERAALEALSNSVGKSMICKQNWLSTSNPNITVCQWQGVVCGGVEYNSSGVKQRHVIKLVRDFSCLLGDFDFALLRSLPYLRDISLRANCLQNFFLSGAPLNTLNSADLDWNYRPSMTLFHSSTLKTLSVSRSPISFQPAILENLNSYYPNLQTLTLTDIGLAGSIPESLSQHTQLRVLVVPQNNLVGTIPPRIFANGLHTLEVERNLLSGQVPDMPEGVQTFVSDSKSLFEGSLPRLPSTLRRISLDGGFITGTLSPSLENCTQLVILQITNSMLSGTLPNLRASISTLLGINLANNNFDPSPFPDWLQSSVISEVDFTGGNFYGRLPVELAAQSQLTQLRLGGNRLSGDVGYILRNNKWSALTSLDLSSNNFTGTLANITSKTTSHLTQLQVLDISGNTLSGSLPVFPDSPRLNRVSLGSNQFSGTLPSFYASRSINYFEAPFNRISGTLPTEYIETGPRYMVIGNNRLSGTLPCTQSAAFTRLDISNNRISGTLCTTTGSLFVQTSALILHSNRISGTVPPTTFQGQLSLLDISANLLTGTLPAPPKSPALITYFKADYNALSGEIPWLYFKVAGTVSLSHNNFTSVEQCPFSPGNGGMWANLRTVRLNNNQLRVPAALLTRCLGQFQTINQIYLDNNELTGVIRNTDIYYTCAEYSRYINSEISECIEYRVPRYSVLQVASLRNNHISGTIPPRIGSLPNLFSLDLSANQFSGVIPSTFSRLRTFNVTLNPGLVSPKHQLPTFLAENTRTLSPVVSTEGLLCHEFVQVSINESQADFLQAYIDPSYYGDQGCRCQDGAFWKAQTRGGVCSQCPDDKISCDPRVQGARHLVLKDYYPSIQFKYQEASNVVLTRPILCERVGVCNPDGPPRQMSGDFFQRDPPHFSCANGFDKQSFLCSRCMPGTFRLGGACVDCSTVGMAVVPVIDVILLALFLLYVYHRHPGFYLDPHRRHAADDEYATLSIFVFYLQVTAILVERDNTSYWSDLVGLQDIASFSPSATTCLDSSIDYISAFYAILVVPLLILAFYGALATIGWQLYSKFATFADNVVREWRQVLFRKKMLFCAFYLLFVLYFSLLHRILSMLRCVETPDTEHSTVKYLQAAPYIDCRSRRYLVARFAAAVALVVYGCGIPAYFLYRSYNFRKFNFAALRQSEKRLFRRAGSVIAANLSTEEPSNSSDDNESGQDDTALLSDTSAQVLQRIPHPSSDSESVSDAQVSTSATSYTALQYWTEVSHHLGFLWNTSRDRYWWWEIAAVLPRKILLALASSMLAPRSLFLPISLFLVLGVAVLLQVAHAPYRHAIDNNVEVFLLFVALLSYLMGILLSESYFDASFAASAMRAVDVIAKVVVIVVMARRIPRALYVSANQKGEQRPRVMPRYEHRLHTAVRKATKEDLAEPLL